VYPGCDAVWSPPPSTRMQPSGLVMSAARGSDPRVVIADLRLQWSGTSLVCKVDDEQGARCRGHQRTGGIGHRAFGESHT